MTTRQLEHQEIINDQRQFPISVVCDHITSAENVGMIFRISEAMGVAHVYLCGDTPSTDHKKVKKTSRSTEKNLDYSSYESTVELVKHLQENGHTTIALELTNNSQTLHQVDFANYQKIAIILGNEQHGVDAKVLETIDLSMAIPMYGKNTSINVVNSLSIALYECTRQLTSV